MPGMKSSLLNTLVATAVATAATLAAGAYVSWEAQQQVYSGVTYMYDTPAERCLSKGVGQFADAGQWPRTSTGQDARAEITARCAADVWAFGPDEPGAVQR
jgi:hypothetical protein